MKIAILRRNGYGDLICTYPLVAHLKQRYPDAEITLFIDPRNAALAPYLFPQERICVFPSGNKYLSAIRMALRQPRFDLVLSAKPTPMKLNNIFLGLLRAEERIAVTAGGKWHEKWIHTRRKVPEGHQALRVLRVLDPSLDKIDHLPRFTLPRQELGLPGPVLFVSLTNNRPTSQMHPSRIAALANSLGVSVAINAIAPTPLVAQLQEELRVPATIFLTPRFEDFLSLIASVDVLLLGDGGTCHIAACLDKPQVTCFAHTPLEQWAPLSDKATLFSHERDVNAIALSSLQEALGGIVGS